MHCALAIARTESKRKKREKKKRRRRRGKERGEQRRKKMKDEENLQIFFNYSRNELQPVHSNEMHALAFCSRNLSNKVNLLLQLDIVT